MADGLIYRETFERVYQAWRERLFDGTTNGLPVADAIGDLLFDALVLSGALDAAGSALRGLDHVGPSAPRTIRAVFILALGDRGENFRRFQTAIDVLRDKGAPLDRWPRHKFGVNHRGDETCTLTYELR